VIIIIPTDDKARINIEKTPINQITEFKIICLLSSIISAKDRLVSMMRHITIPLTKEAKHANREDDVIVLCASICEEHQIINLKHGIILMQRIRKKLVRRYNPMLSANDSFGIRTAVPQVAPPINAGNAESGARRGPIE
jgi:hypothetical protein